MPSVPPLDIIADVWHKNGDGPWPSGFYRAATVRIPGNTFSWHVKQVAVDLTTHTDNPWPAKSRTTCHERPYRETEPGDVLVFRGGETWLYEGPFQWKKLEANR